MGQKIVEVEYMFCQHLKDHILFTCIKLKLMFSSGKWTCLCSFSCVTKLNVLCCLLTKTSTGKIYLQFMVALLHVLIISSWNRLNLIWNIFEIQSAMWALLLNRNGMGLCQFWYSKGNFVCLFLLLNVWIRMKFIRKGEYCIFKCSKFSLLFDRMDFRPLILNGPCIYSFVFLDLGILKIPISSLGGVQNNLSHIFQFFRKQKEKGITICW